MIIKCPECGAEISDKAVSCPKCGCPIAKTTNNEEKKKTDHSARILLIISIIVIAIIAIPVFVGIHQNNERENDFERATENVKNSDNNTHKTERIFSDMDDGTWDPQKDYDNGYGYK